MHMGMSLLNCYRYNAHIITLKEIAEPSFSKAFSVSHYLILLHKPTENICAAVKYEPILCCK